ncbi:hypothetical protein CS0771_65130 [Catellatospora sp. IY07-71]|uniref:hypothetical protein n=1 Tax=Catellatospora sp. IY07-71 TaxID=2728827 RepID=UPI001BB32010|nr:hypothetical protein [Catellatospora sp. IY07-71]BCJ76969.1 hypothetical protein CS0771_65130 [Catellatospora sp. IY07-71]
MTDPLRRRSAVLARQQAAARTIAQEAAFHQARVLLIVDAFSRDARGLRGLARLARLDFVIRFPNVLDRVDAEGVGWPTGCRTQRLEQLADEAALAHRRYGLWTDRYNLIVGGLVSRRLVTLVSGRVFEPLTTAEGHAASLELRNSSAWSLVANRAAYLSQAMNLSAERLDEIIRPALRETDQLPRELG